MPAAVCVPVHTHIRGCSHVIGDSLVGLDMRVWVGQSPGGLTTEGRFTVGLPRTQVQLRWCGGPADHGHAAGPREQLSVCGVLHLRGQGPPGPMRTAWQVQEVGAVTLQGGRPGTSTVATEHGEGSHGPCSHRTCIASRDPYCGWVKEGNSCAHLSPSSR